MAGSEGLVPACPGDSTSPGLVKRLAGSFGKRRSDAPTSEQRVEWRRELGFLVAFAGAFSILYFIPLERVSLDGPLAEAVALAQSYARDHVILCLLPAFFIAGAVSVFLSRQSVTRYLGSGANKVVAYGVASVSGTILSVCSCTVLPLFAGIYRNGAGLGPATAFLYSGPAINVLAIVLTAQVLGWRIGLARAVGAVGFSIVIGIVMALVFRTEERRRLSLATQEIPQETRPLRRTVTTFAALLAILVFANWGGADSGSSIWQAVFDWKWQLVGLAWVVLLAGLTRWHGLRVRASLIILAATLVPTLFFSVSPLIPFLVGVVALSFVTSRSEGELGDWFASSWGFAKQILPLLLVGVLFAGLLLGRPGQEGIVPSAWIAGAVGGNSVGANLVASVAGAFMYFATLTEIPILQGLIGSGMGEGPALALLLAGPALSLPNMLVIHSVLGTRKTVVYLLSVVAMATLTGLAYGRLIG